MWQRSAYDSVVQLRRNAGTVYTKSLLTNAGGLVLREARGAFASEASNGVDAQELAVVLLGGTFIDIC